MASFVLRLQGGVADSSLLTCISTSKIARSPNYNNRFSSKIFRSPNTFSDKNKLCDRGTMNSSGPRLMLPPAIEGRKTVYQWHNLVEDSVEALTKEEVEEYRGGAAKIVGSSHGWLAWYNSSNNNLFLSNDLAGRRIKLPPPSLPGPGEEEDEEDEDEEEEEEEVQEEEDVGGLLTVSKLILSSSPDDDEDHCIAMMSFGSSHGHRLAFCTINTNTTHWTLLGPRLRPAYDDYYDGDFVENEEYMKPAPSCYDDFLYSSTHKRFLCITNSNRLKAWNLEDPLSPRKVLNLSMGDLDDGDIKRCEFYLQVNEDGDNEFTIEPEIRQQNYLVLDEHSNQLFIVKRHIMARVGHHGKYVRPLYYGRHRGWDDSYPYKTVDFDVFKIDNDVYNYEHTVIKLCDQEEIMRLVTYVEAGGGSLDGLVMFVGLNHSFAMSAADCHGLKPNSIYFTDALHNFTPSTRLMWADYLYREPPQPGWDVKIYGGHDIGIFSCESRTFYPCYYPIDVQSIKLITPSPLWFTSTPHD